VEAEIIMKLKLETTETLKLYVDKNNEIQQLRLTKLLASNSFGATTRFDKQGQPIKVENKVEIDQEDLKSLATTIRIFTVNRDKLTFDELSKIDDPALSALWYAEVERSQKEYARLRDGYPIIPKKVENGKLILPFRGPQGKGPIRLVIDKNTITNGQIYDTFIYGDLIHVNRDGKREKFVSWRDLPNVFQMLQGDFVSCLIELVCIIGRLAWVCNAELTAERLSESLAS
jgi:hypothetical protein